MINNLLNNKQNININSINNNQVSSSFNFNNNNNNNSEYSISNLSNQNNSNLEYQNLTRKAFLNLTNVSYEGKMQSESGYFSENNKKNFSNNFFLPALVYVNHLELIFEPICYTCGSFDDKYFMIKCSSCKENFHSYCISNSENITNNIELIKKYNWKCSKCKICEKCEINNNEISLLYCDSCDRAYHISCLDVPLSVVPESGWKCLNCFK